MFWFQFSLGLVVHLAPQEHSATATATVKSTQNEKEREKKKMNERNFEK